MEEKPPKVEEPFEYSPPNRGQKIVTGLMLVALCAVLVYAVAERHSLKQLTASQEELRAELNQEHARVQTLTQKLLAAESTPPPAAAPAPQPSVEPALGAQAPIAPPARVQSHVRRHTVAARAHRAEDPWRNKIQSQLNEQQRLIAQDQQKIEETQDSVQKARSDLESNLKSTRDDLSGSIAKNHDELVALERKGERNYYEFNLQRSKEFQKEGPLSVSLRKSNDKHKYCDLVMIVNDSEVSKKHVNLYEPVLFYPEGYTQPLQLVINSVGKDTVRGYVSEPRYRSSETAAGAAPAGATAAAKGAETAAGSSGESATLKHRPATQD